MLTRCLGCMEQFESDFGVCPHCGYAFGTPAEEATHLTPGTILHDKYIIGKALGYGGFGVTYIAWDGRLEQKVAIKEYLPSEFSTRIPGQSKITVKSGDKSEQFHDGLDKFIDEARRLAKFHNESGIVRILDSFKENDTAYIVMEYLEGETLAEYLNEHGTIDEDTAIAMLLPVMHSLEVVHEAGLIHRDIAPDNIFITKSGEIKLIDFGAARYATTKHTRSLTVIIKQGYSPEEQYRSRGDQGPHTDVYSLGATLYRMITGTTPPDALERRAHFESKGKDTLIEPHRINRKISANTETAILNAMNIRIPDRTPDVTTFIEELQSDKPVKRRYGKIKKIDVYSWPLWAKIGIPAVLTAVLTLGVLLLTGVINFSRYTTILVIPENIVIAPDVEGMNKDEAISVIEGNTLLASTGGTIESEYIPAGTIILQRPVGGSFIEKNGTVSLTVSSGAGVIDVVDGIATVPYITWDTEEDAIAKLLEAGLASPEIEYVHDDNVSAGQVISVEPEAGTEIEEGSVVKIVVSLGPEAFEMPDVTGKEEQDARDELESKGLVISVSYENNSSVPEGQVISQSIDAGSNVQRGDEVLLTVSSGKPTIVVANVVGKPQAEAESELKAQGFKVTVLENYSDTVPAGQVISQNPAVGQSQLEGANITIFVSKGKEPVTTPAPQPTPSRAPGATLTPRPTDEPTGTSAPVITPTPIPTLAHTPTPVVTPTPTPTQASVNVGDLITFGRYEQDNNTNNGKEAIEWIVLALDGNKALIISKYALDHQRYNNSYTAVTWQNCTLRSWLNGTFYNSAFNSSEKNRISLTTVINDDNPEYGTDGGSDTNDKVFILSIAEAKMYFGTNEDRKCAPTDYAMAMVTDPDYHYTTVCDWWLRSPGYKSSCAARVLCDGSVDNFGDEVDYGYTVFGVFEAIRPVLWINL